MKIGKDEVGVFGVVGLILFLPSAYLSIDGFLNSSFWEILIGLSLLVVAFVMYYADLLQHRKKQKQK